MRTLYLSLPLIAAALSGCGTGTRHCPPPAAAAVVYVVEQGWHAEIGIPVEELDGDLAFYRHIFPSARVIMFGYGKKTFFTAPPQTVSEYVLGPFPGPSVVHAVGLRVTPAEAYLPEDTALLVLPPGGSRALSAYIWNELSRDDSGKPHVVAHSHHPDGLFYAARSRYSLLHTCNTWTADALHAAGLPVSGNAVMFSGQVMAQVGKTAESQCRTLFGN